MRVRNKRKPKGESKRVKIDIKKLLIPIFLVLVATYCIFALTSFNNIKTSNPILEHNSHLYLLSSRKDTLKKTLLVFEKKVDNQEKIEEVYIYVENVDKEKAILIYVPSWLYYAGLENDFGNAIPVSSFKYAGDFLQQGRGVEYAIWQIEQLLGINFDSYIWFTPESMSVLKNTLGDISGNNMYSSYYENGRTVSEESLYINSFLSKLNWFNLLTKASTFRDSNAVIYSDKGSLVETFLELKNIQKKIYSIKPYLLNSGSLENIDSVESTNFAGIINYLNINEYDTSWRALSSKLLDKGLEKERVRVEVYNGSGTSGVASDLARKIENAGCDVVRFDNAPDIIENTIFYVPKPLDYKNSLEVISDLIPGQYEIVNERPTFMTTGDIVIILGKDISRMYSF